MTFSELDFMTVEAVIWTWVREEKYENTENALS